MRPGVDHVHRRHDHGAAVGGRVEDGVVGVGDRDVHRPERRHVRVHLRTEPGDVLAVDLEQRRSRRPRAGVISAFQPNRPP